MIILIDNYDSFVYNLYQMCCAQGAQVSIYRNDALNLLDIAALKPEALIFSPGPKAPIHAGICLSAIATFAPYVPMLGVCLGHQAMCEAFGGRVGGALEIMHGKQDSICIDTSSPIFASLPSRIQVARYHSLCALDLGDELEAIAHTEDASMIMALRHKRYLMFGLQFHPESILTPHGNIIMQNFFSIVARHASVPHPPLSHALSKGST